MIKLQDSFSKSLDGKTLLFTQRHREEFGQDVLYVYEIQDQESGRFWAFEVFLAKLQKKDVVMPTKDKDGNNYISPAGEKYPSNNDFGRIAYHLSGDRGSSKRQIAHYKQILIQKTNRKNNKDAKNTDKAAS